MIVHYTFTVHPDRKDQVKAEFRRLKAVIRKHGGRHFRDYASMVSGTPNRLFVYEIDRFAHVDSLNADPEFRAVRLDSLYTGATGVTWGEVEL